jgi:prophage regulatory protein
MAKRILNRQGLKNKGFEYSNVHLLRLEAQGKFPKRVQVSENRVGWLEEEVDAKIDAIAAERCTATPELPTDAVEREPILAPKLPRNLGRRRPRTAAPPPQTSATEPA